MYDDTMTQLLEIHNSSKSDSKCCYTSVGTQTSVSENYNVLECLEKHDCDLPVPSVSGALMSFDEEKKLVTIYS